MKKIKLGSAIINLSLAFYVIYNFYFGWNMKPESEIEKYFDKVFLMFFYIGVAVCFLPLWDMYKRFVERFEENNKRN